MMVKQTINKFLITCVTMVTVSAVSPAFSQSVKPECILTPEAIVDLGTPVFGGALKWKRTVAQDEDKLGQDRLIEIFDEGEGFLVVGEHKEPKTSASSLQLVTMDYNGKVL
ncbi:MAG: hypothetical protein ACPG05_04440, partial [Bdellovibrionales bacterium]